MTLHDGVCCPVCHGTQSKVLESRAGHGFIRRRHLCLSDSCLAETVTSGTRVVKGVRWTTYEFLSLGWGTIAVPKDTRIVEF